MRKDKKRIGECQGLDRRIDCCYVTLVGTSRSLPHMLLAASDYRILLRPLFLHSNLLFFLHDFHLIFLGYCSVAGLLFIEVTYQFFRE